MIKSYTMITVIVRKKTLCKLACYRDLCAFKVFSQNKASLTILFNQLYHSFGVNQVALIIYPFNVNWLSSLTGWA